MIDIHSHVLFGVDDGCENISESIYLIKQSIDKGISDIILTPHRSSSYKTSVDKIKENFLQLKNLIKKERIPINLYLGQEIRVNSFSKEKLNGGEILTLSGSEYILMEYYFDRPCEIVESIYNLSKMGLKPIVAHYELSYAPSIEEAYEIKENGGLIQVDASSIAQGGKIKKIVKNLLKENLVDFIASDVHLKRKNQIDVAYKFVAKKFGLEHAERIFTLNARKIIKG